MRFGHAYSARRAQLRGNKPAAPDATVSPSEAPVEQPFDPEILASLREAVEQLGSQKADLEERLRGCANSCDEHIARVAVLETELDSIADFLRLPVVKRALQFGLHSDGKPEEQHDELDDAFAKMTAIYERMGS
jgi:hypothetical protein